jgi:hypothetical protein
MNGGKNPPVNDLVVVNLTSTEPPFRNGGKMPLRPRTRLRNRASTGPPFRNGGKGLDKPTVAVAVSLLQRSHRFWALEGGAHFTADVGHDTLQQGRRP